MEKDLAMEDIQIRIPPEVEKIMGKLEAAGFQAFVVGGCVRDSLMGRKPDDWDICTDAKPDEMKKVFADRRVIETGLKHGTLTVLGGRTTDAAGANDNERVTDAAGANDTERVTDAAGANDAEIVTDAAGTNNTEGIADFGEIPGGWKSYEVTTFRTDGDYSDNRHPDSVSFTGSVEEDLSRRDFAMNAMAFSRDRGLIDPFGGREDIQGKIIRCVGDPKTRFNEDALRIMRCIRFSSVLGFQIGEETSAAAKRQRKLLDNIAVERIRVEFDKLLCGKDAGRVLREYRDVIAQIIPEIETTFDFDQHNPYHAYDVWEHSVRAVENSEPEPVLRLAAFLHDLGKPDVFSMQDGRGHFYRHEKVSKEKAGVIMRRLRYDNETRRTVCALIEYHGTVFRDSEKQARRLLSRLGEKNLRLLIKLELADVKSQAPEFTEERVKLIGDFSRLVDKVIADEQCFSMKDLAVDGKDMINMGIKQGPDIGFVLKAVFEKVIEGELPNDRDALAAEAERIILKKDNA